VSEQPIKNAIGPALVAHGATGPLTESGKQRASRNSTKHGIFSTVILIKGESKAEYDELLSGLRQTFQPVGRGEELLVEKLATNAWRQRRLLLAEGAEIQRGREFVEWDQRNQDARAAREVAEEESISERGIIQKIENPDVLESCLELLAALQEQIEESGLNQESNSEVLEKIYGDRMHGRLGEDVYDSYKLWVITSECSEEEREREGFASPEQCRKHIIDEIKKEILRLKAYQKKSSSIATERTQFEIVSRNIPEARELERFVRYEAHLSREFDRTLNQLHRMQEKRLGHPAPPRIELELK
jgi:hypothetical protein